MIRDPSDGSVKEPKKPNDDLDVKRPSEEITWERPVIDTTTSGLQTGSGKPENIARVERSHEWIRDYRAGKFKQTDGEGNDG